ncbi:MAG: alpha/beta hydrolase [Nitrospinae bacterium]|nr:alpha/beta hydrolase [Nitrospinota bacterium]
MFELPIVGPTSHNFYSQRLKLHYVDWGNVPKPLVVLIHGGRDHARSWDQVALHLRSEYHLIAPDLRGHGDSEWARGSEYSMVEYVLDLAQLLGHVATFPVVLIGHSLGGAIALQYSGIYPERVAKVVAIEGLGPSPHLIVQRPPHERMQAWIGEMRSLAGRHQHRYTTLADAVQRMREANPRLSDAMAHYLTMHGTNRNEDGTYTWKFDNYVRSSSPYDFNLEDARRLWERITCPTLLMRGADSRATNPERDGRAAAFRQRRSVTIANAGHWVHHDQLEAFLQQVRTFLSNISPPPHPSLRQGEQDPDTRGTV